MNCKFHLNQCVEVTSGFYRNNIFIIRNVRKRWLQAENEYFIYVRSLNGQWFKESELKATAR